jgi:hypothetical protein
MSMQPGRELDAMVAEQILGWESREREPDEVYFVDIHGNVRKGSPSQSWEGMRLVVERMRELGWKWDIREQRDGYWFAALMKGYSLTSPFGRSPHLPHAVCLAALAAIEAERK